MSETIAKTTVEQFVYDLYNTAKRRHLLLGDRRIMVSWKKLKPDFDMSFATFKRYLKRAMDMGYLIRARRGEYILTEKGFFLIQGYEFAITVAGYGSVSQSGGKSPQPATTPPIHKLLPSDYKASELFRGIRLHNVKVVFKVRTWNNGILKKDISDDPYFHIQPMRDGKILVHLKQEFVGRSPAEVLGKLGKYLFFVVQRLYEEYGINVELAWDVKHWEWAYQFDLRKMPHFEGLKNMLAVVGDHMKTYIDYSKGLLEIETNDDMWAMFFFLQPFLSVMTFDQVLQFQRYMQAFETQIAKHLKAIDLIEEHVRLTYEFMKTVAEKMEKLEGGKT